MPITPSSDLTKATDQELVNETSHWYDKLAIRASVEMSRRLKESTNQLNDSIKNLDETTSRYSQRLVNLTIILFVVGFLQLIVTIGTISASWREWVMLSVIAFILIFYAVKTLTRHKRSNNKNG